MSRDDSLADQAVQALAAISRMAEHVDNDKPERHAVRNLKRIAEKVMADACRAAIDLSHQVQEIVDAIKEAKV